MGLPHFTAQYVERILMEISHIVKDISKWFISHKLLYSVKFVKNNIKTKKLLELMRGLSMVYIERLNRK